MSLNVVSIIRATGRFRNWTSQELAEFYRVEASLRRAGIPIETDRGLSDEGDPWFVFCHAHTGDVVIHFARFDGVYIVASPALNGCVRGHDFRALIEAQIDSHPLVVPKPNNSSVKFLIHPAALLVVLVTTCFLKLSLGNAAAAELDNAGHTPLPGSAGHSDSESGEQAIALDNRTIAVVLAAIAAGISWDSDHYNDALVTGPISTWPDATGSDGPLPPSIDLAPSLGSDGGALFHTHAQDESTASSDPTLQDTPSHVASHPPFAGADNHLTTNGVDPSAQPAPLQAPSFNSFLLASAVIAPVQHGHDDFVENSPKVVTTMILAENTDASHELTSLLGTSVRSHIVTAITETQQAIVHTVMDVASTNPEGAVASVNPVSAVASVNPGGAVASTNPEGAVASSTTSSSEPPTIPSAPAAPVHTSADIPATNPTVAVDTAINRFTAEHPNFQVIVEAHEIILYDPALTRANLPMASEQTFTFSDGSSVALIGLPPSHDHVGLAGIS